MTASTIVTPPRKAGPPVRVHAGGPASRSATRPERLVHDLKQQRAHMRAEPPT